jgi:hypothetical protein
VPHLDQGRGCETARLLKVSAAKVSEVRRMLMITPDLYRGLVRALRTAPVLVCVVNT